jgi:hypothetical protein
MQAIRDFHPYQVLARTISRRAIGPGHISQRAARTLPVSILVKPVGGMGVAATQIGRICTIPDLARPDCTSVQLGGYARGLPRRLDHAP